MRRPWLFSLVVVAAFIAVFAHEDLPRAVYVAGYVGLAIALPALGLAAGFRALLVFALVYAVGCVVWRVLLWTDDPRLSGIDDLSPLAGYVVTLPFALILITLGATSSALLQRFRHPSP